MWHTPDGDRELTGAEAALLKAAVTGVAEQIKEESCGHIEQVEYGVRLFDELSWSQRLALLECVATHLFTKTRKPLDLTAANEATVGTLFEHVRGEIEWELDDPFHSNTRWREMVLAAHDACFCPDGVDVTIEDGGEFALPKVTSDDREAWSDLVESLAYCVLWDRDYEMEDLFLDAAPNKAELLKRQLGIDADYFSTAAPDVRADDAAEEVYQRLEQLAQDR